MTELPRQETVPGSNLPFYTGQSRAESYVAEALRALSEVLLDTSIPTGRVQSPSTTIRRDSDSNFAPMASSEQFFSTIVSHVMLPDDGDRS
jgi:hypothetical protein